MEALPLPQDPTLSAYASVLNELGHWAVVLDSRWRIVFVTDEERLSARERDIWNSLLGEHWYSSSHFSYKATFAFGGNWLEHVRESFRRFGPFVLFDTPGGREELRHVVDPALHDLIGEIEPVEAPAVWRGRDPVFKHAGLGARSSVMWLRVRGDDGTVAGTVILAKPRPGMSHLATAAGIADLGHLERMALVQQPGRRPAAVLMADLEASTPLARRLSTAQFFAFGRRLVRAGDQCIIDHGGIVGRHAGDGVVAFFLAETAGSESSAARACIETAMALRTALATVVARSTLTDTVVSFRFGLHWAATIYIGRITTAGRTEVTGLGDEANETARIEPCATGGRALASKALIERLDSGDAQALGIDTDHVTYIALADLATATDKARRDAPSIAVCEI
jgi:class 3 adenylate cyclase